MLDAVFIALGIEVGDFLRASRTGVETVVLAIAGEPKASIGEADLTLRISALFGASEGDAGCVKGELDVEVDACGLVEAESTSALSSSSADCKELNSASPSKLRENLREVRRLLPLLERGDPKDCELSSSVATSTTFKFIGDWRPAPISVGEELFDPLSDSN